MPIKMGSYKIWKCEEDWWYVSKAGVVVLSPGPAIGFISKEDAIEALKCHLSK